MFRKILVANDGSEGAKKALQAALALAVRDRAEVHALLVKEHLPRYGALMGEVIEAQQEAREFFQRVTQEADAAAADLDMPITSHLLPGHPVEVITTFAKDGGFDLLVVGFTGHSRIFERIWGGTSQNLTRLAPCSVLVVK